MRLWLDSITRPPSFAFPFLTSVETVPCAALIEGVPVSCCWDARAIVLEEFLSSVVLIVNPLKTLNGAAAAAPSGGAAR